jgi:NAD(P)H-hydrate epimerase
MIEFNEIAVLDKNASYWDVPTYILMENAGTGLANLILEKYKQRTGPITVAIFCGVGNNGGDGMVAARLLAKDQKFIVRLYLLGRSSEIRTALAIEQFSRLPKNVETISLDKSDKNFIFHAWCGYFR